MTRGFQSPRLPTLSCDLPLRPPMASGRLKSRHLHHPPLEGLTQVEVGSSPGSPTSQWQGMGAEAPAGTWGVAGEGTLPPPTHGPPQG